MPRVEINTKAPDFELADHLGKIVRFSDYAGQRHVLLVFNRGLV